MGSLSSLLSSFGLSGAAGLNAYIPLLTLAIMQHQKVIHLAKPYDAMGEWWCIAILVVLLAIELVVDKVPGADHVNDVIHTAIRPAAGALIFAAQNGNITWVHPGVWMALGLLTSGSVHATKSLARPVVNVSSAGLGAPVVSTIENVISTTLSILAIVAPILAVLLMAFLAWMLFKLFRKFFGGWRKGRKMEAVTVTATVLSAPEGSAPKLPAERWGGGV